MYVTVTEITKQFGKFLAVDKVSFEMEKGSFTTLLGPSGCGKTTTLRCVAGLENPDEGEITLDGKVIFSSKKSVNVPAYQRGIGMVFQSYAIWPHMSVFENVAFPLKVRKLPKKETEERVRNVLELVKLPGFEKRPATQLSGGQQQRVALARSLVMEPKLLLLDVPLSNLDAKLREEMRVEMRDLQRRIGITILYVTHDQREAFSLSDDIKIMIGGKLVCEGAPPELYRSPGDEEVADFLGCTNKMAAELPESHRSDSLVLAETPIGGVLCSTPQRLKGEGNSHVYVRPSSIAISTKRPINATNVFKGTIKRVTYVGSDQLEYILVVNGQELKARGKLHESVDASEDVFVVIDPEGVVWG